MRNVIPYLLLLICIFACNKKNKDVSGLPPGTDNTTGSLTGKVTPANAILKMIAVRGAKVYAVKTDTSSGIFHLENIEEGSCSVFFTAAPIYDSITPVNIIILAGKTTDMGVITATLSKPQPVGTGSLSGTVIPADAVTRITAFNVQTSKSYTLDKLEANGRFILPDMEAGTYMLHFITDTRYLNINAVNVVVVADKNTDVGTFTTTLRPLPVCTLSCDVNGVGACWPYPSVYANSNFTIASFSSGGIGSGNRTIYRAGIILKGVTEPGTYTCQEKSANKITYAAYNTGSGFTTSYQSTEYAGGEGKVVITAIDTVARTIKGTFTAILTSGKNDPAQTKVLTNGVINAKY